VPSRITGYRRFLIASKARSLPARALTGCCNTISMDRYLLLQYQHPHNRVGYSRGSALDNIVVKRLWRTVKY
jgi:hypothetical protein